MKIDQTGVTRLVLVGKRYVFKIVRPTRLIRSWLANRSEWKLRHLPYVNSPIFSLFYFVSVYKTANELADCNDWVIPFRMMIDWYENLSEDEQEWMNSPYEEAKFTSWGLFDNGWRIIDYDRCWQDPRGWVGSLYYGNEERKARKWMKESENVETIGV